MHMYKYTRPHLTVDTTFDYFQQIQYHYFIWTQGGIKETGLGPTFILADSTVRAILIWLKLFMFNTINEIINFR